MVFLDINRNISFHSVINSFLKEHGLKGFEYFLVIWFITVILKSINLYPLFPKFDLNYFASFIGYIILGYYLDNKKFKFDDSKLIVISGVIFIISWLAYCFLGYFQISILEPLYENVPIVFMATSAFLFIKYFDKLDMYIILKNNFFRKIIVSISVCSYGMYYAHFLIILLLEQFNIHSFKLLPFIIFVIVVISWLLTFIFSKIPYLKKFSGV